MTRILLVESDDTAATDMQRSLDVHVGWEVTRVGTVLEAIRAAGETTYDAAVLDYDLPDGTGLDLLDFLRIGSPGIRILLVSDRPGEEIVLHALSHGVGDHLVKDTHLSLEIGRRMDLLLAQPPGEVSSLVAIHDYEAPPPDPGTRVRESKLERAMDVVVGGPISALAVFDSRGKVVASRLAPGTDAEGLGFALGTIHGQIGALWTYAEMRPLGYEMLIETDGGLLGITAIPGTYVIAVLMDRSTPHEVALERLGMAARKIFESLRT